MATSTTFGGRRRIEPGAFAEIKSGVTAPPPSVSPGIAMLIDTGTGAGFGGGSGIAGALVSGKRAVYDFPDLASFRDFVRGGQHWDLARALFDPGPNGEPGITKLQYVRAATTTAATGTQAFTGSGMGSFVYKPRAEGAGANGATNATGQNLTLGFGHRLEAGTVDPTKLTISFWVGTYKGADGNGKPWDGVTADKAKARLLVRSDEFSTCAQLLAWAANNPTFQRHFVLGASTTSTTTLVAATQLTAFATATSATYGYMLATGGTTDYSTDTTLLAQVLGVVDESPNTFFLSDQAGATTANLSILAHILNDARFPKFLFAAGGDNHAAFTGSSSTSTGYAAIYDSANVVVTHSACEVDSPDRTGLLQRSALWTAAYVLGRTAGLPPQTPVTYKAIGVKGIVDELTRTDREIALQAGVLHVKYDSDLGFIVNQGVNTLQDNSRLNNPDGTSHDLALMRIDSMLVNELQTNAKLRGFVGSSSGQTTDAELVSFTQGYLQSRTANPTRDGLILEYGGVTVTRPEDAPDARHVSFWYRTNGPVNKVLFTGYKV
jgi:hypothetical protein